MIISGAETVPLYTIYKQGLIQETLHCDVINDVIKGSNRVDLGENRGNVLLTGVRSKIGVV